MKVRNLTNKNIDEDNCNRILNRIGASWTICYLYSKYIDCKRTNYKAVSTWVNRKGTCEANSRYHIRWITMVYDKSISLMNTNKIGLSGDEVYLMALELYLQIKKHGKLGGLNEK